MGILACALPPSRARLGFLAKGQWLSNHPPPLASPIINRHHRTRKHLTPPHPNPTLRSPSQRLHPTHSAMAALRRDVASCLVLLLLVAVANAFVARQPALSSPRQQQQELQRSSSPQQHQRTGVRSLMAKGGAEMGRKQAKRELMERQRAMAEFNAEIETTPVFQVFAATQKMKGLWMPIAAFKADNVAKGVVDASLQEGIAANFFKGVYKAQVETAVSKAIYDNEKRLREQGQAMHAPLKNAPANQIIWGFKILYKPLQDKVCFVFVKRGEGREEGMEGREGRRKSVASRNEASMRGLIFTLFHQKQFGKTQQPTVVTKDMAKSLFDKVRRCLDERSGGREGGKD